MLVDSVEIDLKAGSGGDGIVSWRREKFIDKGGPDGGDGGHGGSIKFVANHNADTLSVFRYRKEFRAQDGEKGHSQKKTGHNGDDLELIVPVGTIILNLKDNTQIADLTTDAQVVTVAKGGRGGLGNVRFASATHQNPYESTKGTTGDHLKIRLELKLIADIALVGEPNAGKSSLITALTGVNSRIAAFPFSTTEPLLGVMKQGDLHLTLIDLPGIIAGAHKGKGLGTEFLKHTQRVKALIHIVDPTQPEFTKNMAVTENELCQYDPHLVTKPRIIVFNKADLLSKKEINDLRDAFPDAVIISAKEKHNLSQLISKLGNL